MAATPTRDGATGTREAVVQLLLAEGPITAAALADRLRLSAPGVRRHLDALEAQGAVASRMQAAHSAHKGRGRPARVYLLTETGRSRLPHAYDDIAVQALEFLAEHVGAEAVTDFARRRAEGIVAARASEIAATDDLQKRMNLLAEAFTENGYAASSQRVGSGAQLCQHHCPVAHVAEKFPQLCDEEMAVITESLGTYAQRLATIARGDSFCTTFVPTPAARPPTDS